MSIFINDSLHYDRDRSHYNQKELKRLIDLRKTDLFGAIEGFRKYFEVYDDLYAKPYYISALIASGRFEEAQIEIDDLENSLSDCLIYKNSDKLRIVKHNIKLTKLKLYIYQNKNEDALNFYNAYKDEFDFLGNEPIFYIKKMLSQVDEERSNSTPYIYRQTVEYQEEDFINHIKKHMADYNQNNRLVSNCYFNPDFPMDKILEEIKKYIPSEKGIHAGFIEDTYYFKYDQCGRVDNKLTDYFIVVSFINSQQFITMCPVYGVENMPYVDLNYLKDNKESQGPVRRLSQIEKFNKRYGNNNQ